MQGPNEVIMQLLVPPFPQIVLASVATLVITSLLLRVFNVWDPQIRTLFYGLTLLVPLFMYVIITPSVWITRPVIIRGPVEASIIIITRMEEVVGVSYTGILCVSGIIFGAATLIVSYLFGVAIVKKCQGVMEVTEEDEPKLYGIVGKLAKRIGIDIPKIGLTENLQPNAFTIGHGNNTMVVFSSGLISVLDRIELEAVIAHELAHIKNQDFHLMAVVSSLKVIAFFNPATYLSASMLAKEREYLADEVGTKSTRRRSSLKRALIKIASINTPRRRAIIPDLVSGLFIYSQIGSLKAAFTSHPSLDTRLDRISYDDAGTGRDKYKAVLVALVLFGSLALLSTYIMQPIRLVELFFQMNPAFGPPRGLMQLPMLEGHKGADFFHSFRRPLGLVLAKQPFIIVTLSNLIMR
jgi:heat shock protein HtpX